MHPIASTVPLDECCEEASTRRVDASSALGVAPAAILGRIVRRASDPLSRRPLRPAFPLPGRALKLQIRPEPASAARPFTLFAPCYDSLEHDLNSPPAVPTIDRGVGGGRRRKLGEFEMSKSAGRVAVLYPSNPVDAWINSFLITYFQTDHWEWRTARARRSEGIF